MRTIITLDSLTGEELWCAQAAWQRTAGLSHLDPRSLQEECFVRISGSAFTWISPPMSNVRHMAWQREFDNAMSDKSRTEVRLDVTLTETTT